MTAARDLSGAARRRAIERVGDLLGKLTRAGDFVGVQIASETLRRLVEEEGAAAAAAAKGAPVIDLNARREQRRG